MAEGWEEEEKWDREGAVAMDLVFNGLWIILPQTQGDWEPDL